MQIEGKQHPHRLDREGIATLVGAGAIANWLPRVA